MINSLANRNEKANISWHYVGNNCLVGAFFDRFKNTERLARLNCAFFNAAAAPKPANYRRLRGLW